MGTGADVTIYNQTSSPFTVTLSHVKCMYKKGEHGSELQNFNDLSISSYSSSPSTYVEAKASGGCAFDQSAFTLGYLNGAIAMNLGDGLYDTKVTSNSNPGQCQAILAANMPFSSGPSYKFYLYGGPGFIAQFVNSIIDANIAALQKAVKTLHPTFPTGGKSSITVESFSYSTLTCRYAAVVPVGGNLSFSLILKISGSVSGSLDAGSKSMSATVKVTALEILIEGKIDLSGATPQITVTRFACYLDSYEIGGDLWNYLVSSFGIFSILAGILKPSASQVIGIINDSSLNQSIIEALNDALAKL